MQIFWGININKLECKLKTQMVGQVLVISININKLECKFGKGNIIYHIALVLI